MRRPERFHRLAPVATFVLLGGLATACSRSEPATCTTQRGESILYTGAGNPAITDDRATWFIVEALNVTEPNLVSVTAGYRTNTHKPYADSLPIPKSDASDIAFKVGPGIVQFSIQETVTVSDAPGAIGCNELPVTTFIGPLPPADLDPKAVFPTWPSAS